MSKKIARKTVEDGDLPEPALPFIVKKTAAGEYTISIASHDLVETTPDGLRALEKLEALVNEEAELAEIVTGPRKKA